MEPVLFYSPKETPYGCFSNFSRHQLVFMGRTWKTSEAAFQAMKFFPHRMDLVDQVHRAVTPMQAATIGRGSNNPLRDDWDNPLTPVGDPIPVSDNIVDDGLGPDKVVKLIKDWMMFCVVLAKFRQNKDCQLVLLSTGECPLIENAIHDPYWGWGSSRTGVNRLGKILMTSRKLIRLNHVSPLETCWSP